MCFRPAGVEINLNCPSCGKKLPVIGNTVLKKCPFCKYEFTEQDMEDFQTQLGGVPPALPLLCPRGSWCSWCPRGSWCSRRSQGSWCVRIFSSLLRSFAREK